MNLYIYKTWLALAILGGGACTATETQEEAIECPAEETALIETQVVEAMETPLQRDLNRICNGERLSGALELPLGDRAMHTGIWLANQIETQEGRILCSELRVLEHSQRVALLDTKIKNNSVSNCEIIRSWEQAEKR